MNMKRLPSRSVSLILAMILVFSLVTIPASASHSNELSEQQINAQFAYATSVPAIDAFPYQLNDFSDIMPENTSHKHIARLHEDETPSSVVFKNDDGSKSVYLFNETIKYYDNGVLKDKNNNLIITTSAPGYKYTNSANDVKMYFPSNFASKSSPVGVKLLYNSIELEMIPSATYGLPSNLSVAPVVSENKISYPRVFGADTTLVYTVLYSGYKEEIMLNKYTGVSQFSFLVYTHGLPIIEDSNGILSVIDSNTSVIASFGEVFAYDAAGSFINGSISVDTIVPNYQYKMTIAVDETFLTSSSTLYPVCIDPSLELEIDMYPNDSETNLTKNIIDAPLYSGKPNLAAGGSSIYNNLGCINTNYGYSRSIIGLPGLEYYLEEYPLQTGDINLATLNLNCAQQPQNSNTIFLYEFTGGSWSESSVTANNATISDFGSTIKATSYVTPTSSSVSFDITSLVEEWIDDPSAASEGILLKLMTEYESNTTYAVRLYSTEDSSNIPYLYLNYQYNLPISIIRDSDVSASTVSTAFSDAITGISETYGICFSLTSNTTYTGLNIDSTCTLGKNAICNSTCGTLTDCSTEHHKSSSNLLTINRSYTDHRMRVVSYKMCYYNTLYSRHDQVSGLAHVNGLNSVVTTNSSYNNSSYSLKYLMRHELSHNIGVEDDICAPGENCVIKNENGYGEWCTKHSAQIKTSYP